MHGTIAVLMALSGLGCHHKTTTVVAPACYTAAYESCYSAPVVESCYSGCYSAPVVESCYSGCYTPTYVECAPRKKCGLFGGLFGCFKKRRAYETCYTEPVVESCYSGCYSGCYGGGFGVPVYGDYTPVVAGPIYGGEAYAAGQAVGYPTTQTVIPAETITPAVPAAPAAATPPPPAPAAAEPAAPAVPATTEPAAPVVPEVPAAPAVPTIPDVPTPGATDVPAAPSPGV
jgi:hypothetical protein